MGQVDRILRQATTEIVDHIANFLPGLLVSLTLMFAAFVVALLARTAARASAARPRASTAGRNSWGWRPSWDGRLRRVRPRPWRASSTGRF